MESVFIVALYKADGQDFETKEEVQRPIAKHRKLDNSNYYLSPIWYGIEPTIN